MTTTREFALEVRRLIANGWTQGRWAADLGGAEVVPSSPTACRFCLQGAYIRAAMDLTDDAAEVISRPFWRDLVVYVMEARHYHNPVTWNDYPGREVFEVLTLLDEMIATRYPADA